MLTVQKMNLYGLIKTYIVNENFDEWYVYDIRD
jgi:hypothetical protein